MPVGYGTPISTEFRYITVDRLREEGFDATRLSDSRARDLIALASNWINMLTKQWFLPVRLNQRVDGRNAAMAHHPEMIPIQKLFNLKIGKAGLFEIVYPEIGYTVKPRYVQMLSHKANLPSPPEFVVLEGVFGWLEDDFRLVETLTTAPVTAGDTSISVTSTDGFLENDAILVGRDPEPLSGSILALGFTGGNTMLCEEVRFSCPTGVPVVRYGIVPRLIQWATVLIVRDKITPIGAEGDCTDNEGPKWWWNRLQSENVEGYSYSMASLPAAYGHAGGGWTTGNPEVDDILQQFAKPTMYIGNMG